MKLIPMRFWVVDWMRPSAVKLVVIMIPPGRFQFAVADRVPTRA
jgi:hypothetical protein